MNQLPAVASNFYTYCKKCETDRYHKVLTHPTTTTAKLECEVCKGKSTYKTAAEKKKSAAAAKVRKAASSKNSYASEYEAIRSQLDESASVGYSMKVSFQPNQTIKHPKFGTGFIKSVQGDKIEVFFEDEARFLVHNRPS